MSTESRFQSRGQLRRRRATHRDLCEATNAACARFESLELRRLLASADPMYPFASFEGTANAGDAGQFTITPNTSDFSFSGGTTIIGFRAVGVDPAKPVASVRGRAAVGATGRLDPSAIELRDASGRLVTPKYVAADVNANQQSITLAELAPGTYSAIIRGERGTSGAFKVDIFLVGDLDGNAAVDRTDSDLLRRAYGKRTGDAGFLAAADVNMDGIVTSFDQSQLTRNLNDATTIQRLDVTLGITPSAVLTLPDGSLLTNRADLDIAGTAPKGAQVRLDLDGDGYDDGSTIAGAGNAFRIDPSSPLPEGLTNVRARTSDGFGQSRVNTLNVTVDTVAPSVKYELSSSDDNGVAGDGQTTFRNVSLVGTTEAGATVRIAIPGGTREATADASGRFVLDNVPLTLGTNALRVTATDLATNEGSSTGTVVRLAPQDPADVALAWARAMLNTTREGSSVSPPQASRAFAMASAAMYDAINAVNRAGTYFYVRVSAPAGASAPAAANRAAYDVLRVLYPASAVSLAAIYNAQKARIGDGTQAVSDGEAAGAAVAAVMIALRADDGSDDFVTAPVGTQAGIWRPTAPGYAPAGDANWPGVDPFALEAASQFRPDGPPALGSAKYLAETAEVKSLGAVDSKTRTPEQTDIARFWADGAGTFTPPGHWNDIASDLASARNLTLFETTKLFAQLNVAMADSAIAAWDAKYTFNQWRPITAIRQNFGNEALPNGPDANWLPLINTPPFADYISGHSTFSGAAQRVLEATFGTNVTFKARKFQTPGTSDPLIERTYTSFKQAAEEASISRVYGGIHLRSSADDGLLVGRQVGDWVIAKFAEQVDRAAPVVTLAEPDPDSAVQHNPRVSGRVLDGLSDVKRLTVSVDGGPQQDVTFNAEDGRFTFTPSFTAGADDGNHTLAFRGTDAFGNVSRPQTLRFTFDTRAPVVVITAPSNGSALSAESRLIGSVDGTGSALAELSYRIDGGKSIPITFNRSSGAFDAALDVGAISVGSHSIVLTSTDLAGNSASKSVTVTLGDRAPLVVSGITPAANASDVGVTQRPQIFFNRAIDPSSLNAGNFKLSFSGKTLPTSIVPADDGSFAWLFPDDPMPGRSLITVTVGNSSRSASIQDTSGQTLDADGDGEPGGVLTYVFSTVGVAPVPNTLLRGIVADPGPDLQPGTIDDVRPGADGALMTADDVYLNPIRNAEVYIIGRESEKVFTGADGKFSFDNLPPGDVKLVINGRTAQNPPSGKYFPEMVMDVHLNAGQTNTVMQGMGAALGAAATRGALAVQGVYLPRIESSILKPVVNGAGDSAPVTLTTPVEAAPDLHPEERDALTVTIDPDSMVDENGNRLSSANIGISTVPSSLVRDMLPPGLLEHTFDITIQAPGVATFTTPATLTFPNLFNAEPGTKLNFLSFDHTTGRLEIEGTATVSADGKTVTTDPGDGVTHPGWHGLTPPGDPTDGPGPPPPPDPPPCEFTGTQIFEIVTDLTVQVAKCAAGLSGVEGALRTILEVSEKARDAINEATKAYNAYQAGERGAALTSAVKALVNIKSGLVPLFEQAQNQNPLGKALEISKCIEGLLTFASNICDKATSQPGPCNTITTRWVCYGIDVAKTTLGQANSLIEAAKRGLNSTLVRLLCAKVEQLVALINVPTPSADGSGPVGEAPDEEEIRKLFQEMNDLNIAFAAEVADITAYGLTLNDANSQALETHERAAVMQAELAGNIPNTFYMFEYGGTIVRGRTDASGRFKDVLLGAEVDFKLTMFDPALGKIAEYEGRTPPSGQSVQIPALAFASDTITDPATGAAIYPDTDGDGLVDIAERVVGTSRTRPDTDVDGVNDAAEVEQGLDPLGGIPLNTGVLATLPLQGTAQQVVTLGAIDGRATQLLFVATGSSGFSVVDANSLLNPVVCVTVDTPGFASDLDVDPSLNLLAVAQGSAGLGIYDVRDAKAPKLVTTVNVQADSVEVREGVAYVATGSDLIAYDLATGETIASLRGNADIVSMARDGGTLVTIDAQTNLVAYDILTLRPIQRDTLDMPVTGKLFLGGGVAYVGAGQGFATADVSDPGDLSVLSGIDATNIAAGAIVANGSGQAVGVADLGFGIGPVLHVLDVRDPTKTNGFLSTLNLPAVPNGLALFGGIAYVADGTAGLQIVNYRPFDVDGVAPAVSFSSTQIDADPIAAGVQVVEGSLIRVSPTMSDDVQVRNVELIVNGRVVANDISFPWDLSAGMPLIRDAGTKAVVQVRVTDTGGNATTTTPLNVDLIPDTVAPKLLRLNPPDGGVRGQSFRALRVTFDEAMDPNTVVAEAFVLTGPDGKPVTATSVQLRLRGTEAQITFLTLALGEYTLTIDRQLLSDRAGNALGTEPLVTHFTILPFTITWANPLGGDWNDPANWDAGRVPNADDDVLIAAQDPLTTIRVTTGTVEVAAITNTARLEVVGAQLRATEFINNQGELLLTSESGQQAQLSVVNGELINSATGIFRALRGNGGARRFSGSLVNKGIIAVGAGTELALTSAGRHVLLADGGDLRIDGSMSVNGGDFRYSGGQINGDLVLVNTSITTDATADAPAQIRLVGSDNRLVDHLAPNTTLLLDGDAGTALLNAADNARVAGRVLLRSYNNVSLNAAAVLNVEPTGVLQVAGRSSPPVRLLGTIVNRGRIVVPSGLQLSIEATGDASFTQAGGVLEAAGRMVITGGGRFVYSGGEVIGEPFIFGMQVRTDATATSPASFNLRGGTASTLIGNAAAGTTLRVDSAEGSTVLAATADAVNAGRILLDSTESNQLVRFVTAANFANLAGGMIQAIGQQNEVAGSVQSAGRVRADAGSRLTLRLGADTNTLRQANGSLLEGLGSITVIGGTFRYDGGSVNGDVIFIDAAIDIASGVTTPGALEIRGAASRLINNLAAAVTLHVVRDGNYATVLTAASGAANAGRIVLDSRDGAYESRLALLGRFTNKTGAIIQASAGAGGARLITPAEGVTDAVFSNAGAVDATTAILEVRGATLEIDGGLSNGTLRVRDGKLDVTAAPLDAQTVQLTGTSEVLASQNPTNLTLWVAGDQGEATLKLPATFVNRGAIRLDSLTGWGSRITTTGTLQNAAGALFDVVAGRGGGRWMTGNLTNQGTVQVRSDLTFDLAGSLVLAAGGTYRTELTATDRYGRLIASGSATLGGTFELLRPGSFIPSNGRTYEAIRAATLSGTFAALLGTTINATTSIAPEYSATSLTLRVNGSSSGASGLVDGATPTTPTATRTRGRAPIAGG